MKRVLLFGFLLLSVAGLQVNAQSSPNTLDVVNWNIEWFGAASNGPFNKNLQEENVKKVLWYLDADIYGLTEIVDTMRLRRVVDSLGPQYGFIVSNYSSLASTPIDADWLSGQKLAFVYKKSIFTNVRTRALMRNSTSAYSNFASGRFPFLLSANVTLNGKKRAFNFFLLHGKAGSTPSDHSRKKGAADELKDTLDLYFPHSTNIILGDFNDDLDQPICTSCGNLSSYDKIIKDSTDNDHYRSISLALSRAGENSTISFKDVIDHQVISNEADSMYVANSIRLRKDVVNVVPDYNTRNTSDHYPVFSSFSVMNGDTNAAQITIDPLPPATPAFTGIKVWPNPFVNQLYIKSANQLTNLQLVLYNVLGQKLWSQQQATVPAQTVYDFQVPDVPAGIYFLQLRSKEENKGITLLRL